MIKSKLGWNGKFIFKIKNLITGEIKTEIIENRIMDDILDELVSVLDAGSTDLEIKYLAVGTGNTAVTDGDTELDTEFFRIIPSISPVLSDTGEITTEFTLIDTDGNCQIEEVGIFVGSTASAAADSGKLLSRILWSHEKTSSEEITLIRIDTISRV